MSLTVEDVRAGGLDERREAVTTEAFGGGAVGAAAFLQPRAEVGPPAAGLGFGVGEPVSRIRWIARRRRAVAGLGIAGRVDDGGDVAAAGQHEAGVPAEQLGRAVARGPWREVVGDPG